MSAHTVAPPAAPAPREPQFFGVPVGTRSRPCTAGCGATIYMIVTKRGRWMPVNCDIEGGRRPRVYDDANGLRKTEPGAGISHFVDCPKANQFRRGSRT
jgi:hypothetical protein